MKSFSVLLLSVLALGVLPLCAIAQDSQPMTQREILNGLESTLPKGYQGLATDWTDHHLIFSHPVPGSPESEKLQREPRYWMQQLRRSRPEFDELESAFHKVRLPKKRPNKLQIVKDWSANMGSGAKVGGNVYPAKYSFNPISAPSCTNDYVVYNTSNSGNLAGSATVATGNATFTSASGVATGDTITVGGTTYTWETTLTAANQIKRATGSTGPDNDAGNLEAAINANAAQCLAPAGGPCFGTGTVANTSVSALVSSAVTNFVALSPGSAGNSIALATNASGITLSGSTLSGGANATTSAATLFGYNNLYSGTCTGTVPNVLWAYATTTAGQVQTSPVLSSDGTQIAFIHTASSGAASLALLKWAASPSTSSLNATTSSGTPNLTAGTFTASDIGAQITGNGIPAGTTIIAVPSSSTATMSANATASGVQAVTIYAEALSNPGVPVTATTATYRACTAPCMVTIPFGNGNNDSISSPNYDYASDTLWVGDNACNLHKFTGVFAGTPAEVTTAPWPKDVNGSCGTLTSPVYDSTNNVVWIGDHLGSLDRVDASSGVSTTSKAVGHNPSDIADAPLVDPTAGKAYLVVSDDGGSPSSGLFQFDKAFASGAGGTEVTVGFGVTTAHPLYGGAFDNQYFTSASGTSPTGNLYVCGNAGGSPMMYRIPITSNVPGTAVTMGGFLATNAATQCSPLTEFFNTTAPHMDFIFSSVSTSGYPTSCNGASCVMSFNLNSFEPNTSYVRNQLLLDSNNNLERVTTAGTSGASAPTFITAIGNTTTSSGVTWTNEGLFELTQWQVNTVFPLNTVILDSNNNFERVTSGIAPFRSALVGSAPTWSTTIGGMVADGDLTWTNEGSAVATGTPVSGGTSGIVIDNASAASGASQIYFSTMSNSACGTGGTGGCAIQGAQVSP